MYTNFIDGWGVLFENLYDGDMFLIIYMTKTGLGDFYGF